MSLSNATPDLGGKIKSFWQRPEGKTGMVVLGVIVVSLLLGLSSILPILVGVFNNIIQLTLEGIFEAILLLLAFVLLTNKQLHNLVRNLFKSVMRGITGMFIEIDPIGILKNNLALMNKRKTELDDNVTKVSGAKKNLELAISKKKNQIDHDRSMVTQADKEMAAERDPLRKQRLALSKQSALADAGMKMKTVENLQALYTQTDKMYTMLVRWTNLADFQIQTTTNQVDNLAEERRSIMAATRALSSAKRLIKGDPEQLQLVNQTLEFLAEDTANKLGDMEDFARYSEKYLDNMDLENGASASDAEAKFKEFESKLLSAGNTGPSALDMQLNSQGVYEPAAVPRKTASGSYDDLLR